MSSKIILKKSSIAAKAPVVGDIDFGELALNYNDGKLYYKKSDNSIDFFSSGQLVGGGANVTTSDTAPLSPLDGDLWWDSQTAALKIYYNDGSSTQWVDISTGGGGGGATYNVSATSNIGGAYITLSGSDSSTDNLLIASGSNTTVSQTDADTITIDVDLSSREPLISKSTGYAKWNGSAWIFVNDTYLTGTKVDSFNTRTGAITLTSADVTTALTYTPYNATNPSGYTNNTGTVTSVSGTGTVSGLTLTGSVTNSGSLTLGGAITGFATTAHNHSLDSLTNTTITANSSGEILKWNGTAWINNTLAEAGIATPSDISSAISGLVNGADAAYDTLKEIQDAMATDAELAAAISGLTIGNGTQTITAGTYLTGGGTFTANQTGNSSVTLTVDATSANTASKVVARDISGNFSAGTITAALSGNATSATSANQWTTGRTVAMTGDVTYTSSSLNGTANVTGTATLATVATPGTYSSVTVDAKGRVTAGANPGYLTGTKVDSFNTRTGAVTLTSADVTTALTYTPYNATNPSGYTTNTGTVTSVATANGTGISVTGGPITTSGTLTITNTAPNVTTNITTTHSASTVTVNSSDGTNGTINAATTSLAGVLTGTDKTKLDGIATGAQVNVATNLGYTTAASTGTVTSSTGTSTTLPAATTTLAGLLTGTDKTKLDGLVIGTTVQAYSTNLSSWASIATSTKQDTLVSATNIKTVNSTSILGSGNIAVQPTLVSGTNIKTINGTTLLGSGDLVISGATYNISSETSTGGALLRLSGSDLSTDDIKFAAGTDITVVRTDANTITINSTAGAGNGLNTWVLKTSAYTAVDGDRIIESTQGGAFAITLPATPITGAYVQIADGFNWGAAGLTILRNGSTIESIADDLLLDVQGAIIELVYSGTSWEVFASVGTGTANFIQLNTVQTLTNKRITQRVVTSGTTSGTINPTGDTADLYIMSGLTATTTIGIPTGTPTDGQKLLLKITDNGTARTLAWIVTAGGFRAIGTDLPLTTTATKLIYVGSVYNSTDGFWDVVAVSTQA